MVIEGLRYIFSGGIIDKIGVQAALMESFKGKKKMKRDKTRLGFSALSSRGFYKFIAIAIANYFCYSVCLRVKRNRKLKLGK